jgi:ABC-type transport system substrate-binding protein
MVACTPKQSPQDDVVVSVLDTNIPHLDPIHSMNKYSSTINGSIFEGLYHYHYLKRPVELEPALATDMPKVSADGKTYTISIKPGVVFQDDPAFPNGKGRELVAEDFIYSWKRLADPKNKALGWWLFDGLILGLNEWRDKMRSGKASYDSPVSGLQALDSHTLQIQLTRESFQFLHYLATPPTMVVAQEVVKKYGKDIVNHPIGTGPFRLKKWVRNSEVVLVKNPRFRESYYPKEASAEAKRRGYLKSAGQRLPLADKVIVRVITERQPLWLAFLKGELDHGIIPKDNYDQVFENEKVKQQITDKGIRVHYLPRPDVTFTAFNMEHAVLGKNKNLRKALSAAIDRDLILEKFYNRRGQVAESPVPPGLKGYDPKYKNPIAYDLEKAKGYLATAGFPNGEGLPVFDYELPSTGTWSRQYGELLKDQWGKIGVKIRLNANTWPQFDKKIKTKKATMFDMAWNADYPDAENFMQLFYSKNISPGSNNFNFMNRDFDKLYEKMLTLRPGPERFQLIRQMVDQVNEEVPGIFVVHRVFRLPYHGWLENYYEYPIIYDHLQYYRVNREKKAELIKNL